MAHVTARGDRLFIGSVRLKAKTKVRAVQGATTSLTWSVFTP